MRESRPVAWTRLILLGLLLAVGGRGSPWPWSVLWLAVPVAVAAGLLLAWRFGRAAFALPAVLLVAAAGLTLALGLRTLPPWLSGWVPLAALVGTWMGLREEGGGPTIGERAWMLAPLLALAAVLPVTPGFPEAIGRFDHRLRAQQQSLLSAPETRAWPAVWREALEASTKLPAESRRRELTPLVTNALFLWVVLLVGAGRTFAARGAAALGWPPLSRPPFHHWRMPDAALVPLIAGLALAVFAGRAWEAGAWTLLVNSALGYSVQGLAVVGSVLLSRGMPPVFVTLTMVFVIAVSLLWVLPAIAVVGLSDVWLDYRRLEPSPKREA